MSSQPVLSPTVSDSIKAHGRECLFTPVIQPCTWTPLLISAFPLKSPWGQGWHSGIAYCSIFRQYTDLYIQSSGRHDPYSRHFYALSGMLRTEGKFFIKYILPLYHRCSPPWTVNHITYLEIKIGKVPSSHNHFNYLPFLSKIVSELDCWADLPYFLFWELSPIQNGQLPKTPITPPNHPAALTVQRSPETPEIPNLIYMARLLTVGFPPKTISSQTWSANLPNIRLYNVSCLLRVGLDWIPQASGLNWNLKW